MDISRTEILPLKKISDVDVATEDSTAEEIYGGDFDDRDFPAVGKSSSPNSVIGEEVGVVAKKGMGKMVSPAGGRKETFYTEALSSEGIENIMSPLDGAI